MTTPDFSSRLLTWFDKYGRKDLPWQCAPTPYRVWVSEIMLQQTQVNTVIPYFERFIARFPEVQTLAAASLDDVLHLWTGLGYYARARHLHHAARQICSQHNSRLPADLAALQALPGIGRSTAGAILALAYGQRQAILDGNVKRVLCRYHAVAGWPGDSRVSAHLWELAEQHTPAQHTAAYTQAIMDLGATLCRRGTPACAQCPLQHDCQAYQTGTVTQYPAPRPRKTLPVRATQMLMFQNVRGEVLLEQRPPRGVWGGLWSFPECASDTEPACPWPYREISAWPAVRHTFTHFHLDITPVHVKLSATANLEKDPLPNTLWYDAVPAGGLPAPVARLLAQLWKHTSNQGESL